MEKAPSPSFPRKNVLGTFGRESSEDMRVQEGLYGGRCGDVVYFINHFINHGG